ncbi:MAG: CaiB/BaiF CoA transferase family protein [Deltaproteobacteria bacterium]
MNPTLPLAGIRVLDLTRVLAGPYCTMILADLGAEVVKVELPVTGDDSRQFGPFLPSGMSAYFASINRGKKSVALDLHDTRDVETVRRLATRADVFVENFRPGTLDAFGLASEALRTLNPSLIYASLSGFGRSGDAAGRPAYDIVVQAMSGLMSITGEASGRPVRVGTSISDILTGMFAAIGILAALHRRGKSANGADLDLAMLDSTVAALENAVSRFDVTGTAPQPLGTRHPSIAPFQSYATADVPIVVAVGNEPLWKKLCDVLGCPELADDRLFIDNAARSRNVDRLERELLERLRTQPAAWWLARLAEAGIPSGPIRSIADVVHDPQLAARGMLHRMHSAEDGGFLTAGSPLRLDGAPLPLSDRAPQLGEHTQEVRREWLGEV